MIVHDDFKCPRQVRGPESAVICMIKLNMCGFGIKGEVSKKHKKYVKNLSKNGVQNPQKP